MWTPMALFARFVLESLLLFTVPSTVKIVPERKKGGGGGGEIHRSQVKDRTTAKIIYQSQIKDRTVQKNKTNEQKRFINYRSKIVPRKKFINHRSKIVTGEKCSSASGKSLLAIQFMVELLLLSEEN